MTPPADAAEPPMEEILASIRRIISEEPPQAALPGGEADAGAPSDTQLAGPRLGADEHLGGSQEAAVGEVADRLVKPPEPAEAAAIDAAPAGGAQNDALVSEDADARTGAAFDKLAGARQEGARTQPGYVMPAPGRSLEDVTRDLLAPLLKAWLDENLPAIVEARVDEEVTRIARGRVR